MFPALAAHTAFLLNYGIHYDRAPIAHVFEAFVFLSWCMSAVFAFMNATGKAAKLSKYFVPVIMLFFALGFAGMLRSHFEVTAVRGWLVTHVVMILLAYGLFFFNFVSNVLYLFKERQLKRHSSSVFHQALPALDTLDTMSLRSLVTGFAIMSFGVLLGFLYTNQPEARHWLADGNVLFGLASWLCYGVILHVRVNVHYRGRGVLWLSVASFVFMIGSFVSVNLLHPSHWHSFTS